MASMGMVPIKLKSPKKSTTCSYCNISLDNDSNPLKRILITSHGNYCSTKCKNAIEDGE